MDSYVVVFRKQSDIIIKFIFHSIRINTAVTSINKPDLYLFLHSIISMGILYTILTFN